MPAYKFNGRSVFGEFSRLFIVYFVIKSFRVNILNLSDTPVCFAMIMVFGQLCQFMVLGQVG